MNTMFVWSSLVQRPLIGCQCSTQLYFLMLMVLRLVLVWFGLVGWTSRSWEFDLMTGMYSWSWMSHLDGFESWFFGASQFWGLNISVLSWSWEFDLMMGMYSWSWMSHLDGLESCFLEHLSVEGWISRCCLYLVSVISWQWCNLCLECLGLDAVLRHCHVKSFSSVKWTVNIEHVLRLW